MADFGIVNVVNDKMCNISSRDLKPVAKKLINSYPVVTGCFPIGQLWRADHRPVSGSLLYDSFHVQQIAVHVFEQLLKNVPRKKPDKKWEDGTDLHRRRRDEKRMCVSGRI